MHLDAQLFDNSIFLYSGNLGDTFLWLKAFPLKPTKLTCEWRVFEPPGGFEVRKKSIIFDRSMKEELEICEKT